jgi:hypothetical protein
LAEEHSAIPGTTAPSLRRRVSMALPMASYQSVRTRCGRVVVLQRDVFKRILQPMMMDSSINDSWTYAVMFEYLRSLQRFRIPGVLHFVFVPVSIANLGRCSRCPLTMVTVSTCGTTNRTPRKRWCG